MTEVFAFTPSDADYTLVDGFIVSFYDTELKNSYKVEKATEKVNECIEKVDMESYKLGEDEHWIRIDYESIQEGEPERIHHE